MAFVPVDLGRLTRRVNAVAREWAPGASVDGLTSLHGGASSLTYEAKLHCPDRLHDVDTPASESDRVVVKVAPPGLKPVRNRDVLRQASMLRALSDSTIPVPTVLFEATGESLVDPPFFVMSHVVGDCLEPLLDAAEELPPVEMLSSRARKAARLLAKLHTLDLAELAPLSHEPTTNLVLEVERWRKALRSQGDGASDESEHCATELLTSLPTGGSPGLVHGDYRMGNVLCQGADVSAVIDWEIWTLGDPRQDLAWLCTFTDKNHLPTAVREIPGYVTEADLVASYGASLGRPVEDMAWFHALAAFKQAAVIALLVKNNRRREAPDAFLESIAPMVEISIERARARLTEL